MKKMKKIVAGIGGFFVVIAILAFANGKFTTHKALADENVNQDSTPNANDPNFTRIAKFEYAVKFVCGKFVPAVGITNLPETGPVKPGNYATTINIHDPWFTEVTLVKKAVQALPEPEQGKPSQFQHMVLNPDGATEADCTEIRKFLNITTNQFIEGFFVIYSNKDVDVSPVYTAQGLDEKGNPSGPVSIEVREVKGRVI